MPQHKSAAKRVRQTEKKRIANRLHRSRLRTMMKKLNEIEVKEDATAFLNVVKAYLDRLASKRIIHKNKAANYKSDLDRRVNTL
jgi:small subunit ribosomal protein S20